MITTATSASSASVGLAVTGAVLVAAVLHAVWNLHKHFPETPIMGVGGIGRIGQ